MILAGCGNDDIKPDYGNDAPTFSASIDDLRTRATDMFWDEDDQVGITGSGGTNVCHRCVIDEEGQTNLIVKNPDEQIYYQNSESVTFTAYYPWTDLAGETTISASTADQSKQKDFDFLWASGTGKKATPNVKLTFSHKMSKVTFTFINGKGMDVSTITYYTLSGFKLNGTFNPTTGTCAATGSAAKVTKYLTGSKVEDGIPAAPFILFPQTPTSKVQLEIYDSNLEYYSCYLTFPEIIEAGNNYTFNITVNKTGLIVNSATIEDWKDYEWEEGEGEASASSSDYPEE